MKLPDVALSHPYASDRAIACWAMQAGQVGQR